MKLEYKGWFDYQQYRVKILKYKGGDYLAVISLDGKEKKRFKSGKIRLIEKYSKDFINKLIKI